jgi:peptide chain release factor 1
VQRVPVTERRGRVHTSTVTVSVLDDEDEGGVVVRDEDLRHRWFSGTGAGGQHRNKHQCCLELIHVPTGVSRTAQGRSREDNAREARAALEQALGQEMRTTRHGARNEMRAAQIGLGMRADKRRTYRFQDDRVVDHESGKSMKASHFMRGRIDGLWPSKGE